MKVAESAERSPHTATALTRAQVAKAKRRLGEAILIGAWVGGYAAILAAFSFLRELETLLARPDRSVSRQMATAPARRI